MPDSQVSPDGQKTTVKCKDCGYLAWRHQGTWELIEVDLEHREGTADNIPSVAILKGIVMGQEVCFCAAHDLRAGELSSAKSQEAVIWKDRACSSYTKWCPGLSPKEHMQMHWIAEQRMWQEQESERNRAHEREMELLTRQAESAREDQRRRDEDRRHAEIIKGNHKTLLWTVIVTFLCAVISGSILSKVIDVMASKW